MNPNIKAAKNLTEKASEFVSAHRKFLWIIAAAIAAAGITVLIVIGFTGEDGSDPRISKTAVFSGWRDRADVFLRSCWHQTCQRSSRFEA